MKTRILHTKFWQDEFVGELSPTEKLLFIYFLTNDLVNIIHCYECPDRKILFDTGVTKDQLEKAREKFHNSGKILFKRGFVFLKNSCKYENYIGGLNEKAKERLFNNLPDDIRSLMSGINDNNFEEKKYKKNKKGYIHRLVAESILQRPLTNNEVVHHIDRNPQNNSISNLSVMSIEDHILYHKGEYKGVLNPLETLIKGSINHKSEIINNKSKLINKKSEFIKEEIIKNLCIDFPDIENNIISDNVESMGDWLKAEGKTKKDYMAFARNWIRRGISEGNIINKNNKNFISKEDFNEN